MRTAEATPPAELVHSPDTVRPRTIGSTIPSLAGPGLLLLALLLTRCASSEGTPAPPAGDSPTRDSVVALGRLEPGDGVVSVGAPPGERVSRLLVALGGEVEAGAEVAVLESHEQRRAERERAAARLRECELQVERAERVGPSSVEAQEAEVRRLEADLALARKDLARQEALHADHVAAARDREHQAAVVERGRRSLEHARAELARVRAETDAELAQSRARRASAEAELAVADALLARATVRAPIAGRVLAVHAWPGESVRDAILELGDTSRIYAVAEVYETDAPLVAAGQRAQISSPALRASVEGVVEQVGSMIHRNDVLGLDPGGARDSRVVEVRVRLSGPTGEAARLIHHQVDVRIDLGRLPQR